MLRWFARIAGAIGLLLLICVVGAVVAFGMWRSNAIDQVQHDPDRRIVETSRGPIEFATLGEGLPVLSLHGSPGGYDQALIGPRVSPDTYLPGTMTIAVSRPGFLGTPLGSGPTHEAEADLYAAFLDALGIERVLVIANSAGGAPGLQFALRHPERTIGLVLRSARVTAIEPRDDIGTVASPSEVFLTDMAFWAVRYFPQLITSDFDAGDPVQVEILERILRSVVPSDVRSAEGTRYVNPEMDVWPIENILAPTLILHGDADSLVPYANALHAADKVPNSRLVTFEGGTHFIAITEHAAIARHVSRFIATLSTE